jgi:hypothetical protein
MISKLYPKSVHVARSWPEYRAFEADIWVFGGTIFGDLLPEVVWATVEGTYPELTLNSNIVIRQIVFNAKRQDRVALPQYCQLFDCPKR